MDQKVERARRRAHEAVWPIRIGVLIGFVVFLFEVDSFITTGGSIGNFAAILCGVVSGVLSWVATVQLARESKRAFLFLLVALGLGIFRGLAFDGASSLTIPTILLFALFAWFLSQFVYWIRSGVLKWTRVESRRLTSTKVLLSSGAWP